MKNVTFYGISWIFFPRALCGRAAALAWQEDVGKAEGPKRFSWNEGGQEELGGNIGMRYGVREAFSLKLRGWKMIRKCFHRLGGCPSICYRTPKEGESV